MKLFDTKIYLITVEEKGQLVVSHGVGNMSLKNYILPVEPVFYFKPLEDQEGFYLLTAIGELVANMRFMVMNDAGKWEAVTLDDDIYSWMWRNDGASAVIIDDSTQTYYCSTSSLEQTYRQKGKQAKMFADLELVLRGMVKE